jgi:carboxylesterase
MTTEKSGKLGVLLLHGYTSSLDTVNGLVPTLERQGRPYRMPILRGHGTHQRDLRGVTWRDWYADASAALDDLRRETDRAVVVGLSMGGLVAAQLGIDRAADLAGVALVAPAFAFANPLAPFSGLLRRVVPYAPAPRSVYDPDVYRRLTNYPQVEASSFASLYEYSRIMSRRVAELRLPLLVIASRRDQVIPPRAIEAMLQRVGTPPAQREVRWLEQSGHDILMDMERETAFAAIGDWLAKLDSQA